MQPQLLTRNCIAAGTALSLSIITYVCSVCIVLKCIVQYCCTKHISAIRLTIYQIISNQPKLVTDKCSLKVIQFKIEYTSHDKARAAELKWFDAMITNFNTNAWLHKTYTVRMCNLNTKDIFVKDGNVYNDVITNVCW